VLSLSVAHGIWVSDAKMSGWRRNWRVRGKGVFCENAEKRVFSFFSSYTERPCAIAYPAKRKCSQVSKSVAHASVRPGGCLGGALVSGCSCGVEVEVGTDPAPLPSQERVGDNTSRGICKCRKIAKNLWVIVVDESECSLSNTFPAQKTQWCRSLDP
jgi:hypothetical protein